MCSRADRGQSGEGWDDMPVAHMLTQEAALSPHTISTSYTGKNS